MTILGEEGGPPKSDGSAAHLHPDDYATGCRGAGAVFRGAAGLGRLRARALAAALRALAMRSGLPVGLRRDAGRAEDAPAASSIEAIPLRPSRALCGLLAAAYAAAIAVVPALDLELPLQAAIVLAALGDFAFGLLRHGLRRGRHSVVGLACRRGTEVVLSTRAGRAYVAHAAPGSLVTPQLVVVRLRVPGRWMSRWLVLPGDCADRDALRRLRVWLRWGPPGRDPE